MITSCMVQAAPVEEALIEDLVIRRLLADLFQKRLVKPCDATIPCTNCANAATPCDTESAKDYCAKNCAAGGNYNSKAAYYAAYDACRAGPLCANIDCTPCCACCTGRLPINSKAQTQPSIILLIKQTPRTLFYPILNYSLFLTFNEKSTKQLALIQIQTISQQLPFFAILIELAHLPPIHSLIHLQIK
ncbi:unnamed protein product [Rotaria sordida]|uniref:Uncharacterized protein n=1 Tax=Rotaria sordida TaxID=392033 RepID=A0A815ML31_9BILA|nr:unnamed protein product [Rotaria sordida]